MECEVRENCKSYDRGDCWHCNDYSLYWPENPHILCKRQIRERKERKLAKKLKKQTEASKRGKRSKRKGYDGEAEVVKLLQKYGIKAERVPLSGALKSEKYSCDVHIPAIGKRVEVKRRKSGLKTIQKWMAEDTNSNYIFFREDYGDWVVIMPVMEFIELLENNTGKEV
jgi:Holliday junction resolvase